MDLLKAGLLRLCSSSIAIRNVLHGREDSVYELLSKFINEIELFNAAYGLVSYKNTDDLVVRHVLDSLAPLGVLIQRCKEKFVFAQTPFLVGDIGSGAGFPGIPLAIALPQLHITLIERMHRRAGFLRNVQAILGIKNISVEESQPEQIPREMFQMLTFRALSPLKDKIIKEFMSLLTPDGFIAAYKGRKKKILEEIAFINNACYSHDIICCNVPFLDEERHILIIEQSDGGVVRGSR